MPANRPARTGSRISYKVGSDSDVDDGARDDSDESVNFEAPSDSAEDVSDEDDEDFEESEEEFEDQPRSRRPRRGGAPVRYMEESDSDDSGNWKRSKKKAKRWIQDDDDDVVDDDFDEDRGRRGYARAAKTNVIYNDDLDLGALDEEEQQMMLEDSPPKATATVDPTIPSGPEIEVIYACKKRNGVDQFYCKMKGFSHRQCDWLTEEEVIDIGGQKKMKNFLDKNRLFLPLLEEPEDEEADDIFFDPQWLEVDRIIAEDEDFEAGQSLFLVKWKGLQYDQCTWELRANISDAQLAFDLYEKRNRVTPAMVPRSRPVGSHLGEEFRRRIAQESKFKGNHQLRDYQNVGYTWLIWCWANNRGCILGDEMGLGKTVQVVAFLNFLVTRYQRPGPYLVVVPLSTIPHWEREIEAWTDLNCVVFHGSEKARDMIVKHEFFYNNTMSKKRGQYKFHILLTTFEMIGREFERLKGIQYETVVIDEAHKLKNKNSSMFKTMSQLQTAYRLMMTGTPVQNNIVELWTLLKFLNPDWIWSEEDFVDEFGDLQSAEQLSRLHEIIRPFLLRRCKEDVIKELPPKVETLIKVKLTTVQKMNYKAVVENNRAFLSTGKGKALAPSLNNIMMLLRKVCNHPYLLQGAEERALSPLMTWQERAEQLIKSSSKLILLDKLLKKLREHGHKVLIFSQMTKMLDVLEDYLRYRGYNYERIDGGIGGQKRQQGIDRFQDLRFDRFVFLLSTKAGGVGINLTKADTCVIYDSDWNPQNDLQAQARCHRIGQEKNVMVYRLLTEGTYEERMWEVASKKLGLDQAVLAGGGQDQSKRGFTAEQMNMLLRHGAYELYKEGDREQDDKALEEEDIDQILQRATKIDLENVNHEGGDGPQAIHGLAGFSTATFAAKDEDGPDIDDENFWEKILPEQVTAMKLKAKLDADTKMDAPACQRFMLELRSLVEFFMDSDNAGGKWAPSNESIQEKEALSMVLEQVQTHPSFNAQDRKKVTRWLAIVEKPRRRGAAPGAMQELSDSSADEVVSGGDRRSKNRAAGSPEDEWRCARCTLENSLAMDACQACHARRPKTFEKAALAYQARQEQKEADAKAKGKGKKRAKDDATSKSSAAKKVKLAVPKPPAKPAKKAKPKGKVVKQEEEEDGTDESREDAPVKVKNEPGVKLEPKVLRPRGRERLPKRMATGVTDGNDLDVPRVLKGRRTAANGDAGSDKKPGPKAPKVKKEPAWESDDDDDQPLTLRKRGLHPEPRGKAAAGAAAQANGDDSDELYPDDEGDGIPEAEVALGRNPDASPGGTEPSDGDDFKLNEDDELSG